MIVLESDKTAFFDVDDTLIRWIPDYNSSDAKTIWIKDELGHRIPLRINMRNVEALKMHRLRGHQIVVWSAGGWDWAARAVKLLGLEKYVDLVMSKPAWWYDDMPPEEVLLPAQRRFNEDEQ